MKMALRSIQVDEAYMYHEMRVSMSLERSIKLCIGDMEFSAIAEVKFFSVFHKEEDKKRIRKLLVNKREVEIVEGL